MKTPTFAESFETLCIYTEKCGMDRMFFGDSLKRVRQMAPAFLLGNSFPELYFEFPLMGDPSLSVTFLYSDLERNMQIDSPLAIGYDELINYIADTQKIYPDVGFGFELDTEKTIVPPVAVHFEPRNNPLLATRFFELLGEKERLHLYDDMRKSLPKNWEPAYFGLFRERPEAPLRVCGYLQKDEVISCKEDPSRIKDIFDKVGFTAFDQTMISQITEVLRIEPAGFDYQFDIYPDGTMGKIFSIEIMLKERSEKSIRKSFEKGAALQILDLMRKYGLAEEKSRLLGEFTFERSVPVELKDGSLAPFHLGFRPKWFKIRWDNTKLVPAKCYFLLQAAFEETFF